jgi:selenocysteine lyase/cysteine desulfurase
MMYDVEKLRREEFPWTERREVTYLNNASIGAMPRRSVDALNAFNTARAEPFRLTLEHEWGTTRRARELAARLIGATPDEIALVPNTSGGINLAALTLPLSPGDVVLSPDKEFPANVYPWMARHRSGVRLEQLPVVSDLPDEEALLRALERPEVRVLAISWVGFAHGYRADLERLGDACRANDVYLVVDGIQGLGPLALDVKRAHVDIFACGAQKWLMSPWGTGFVYVRPELVRQLQPAAVGWLAVKGSDDLSHLTDYDLTWRDDARRFEVNTLNAQDYAAFNASVELLLELGPPEVERHVAALLDAAIDWVADRDDVRLVTPAARAHRAGILSVVPRDPVEASKRLRRARVWHALRESAIRLSPHCWNTREEVLRALAVMVGEG